MAGQNQTQENKIIKLLEQNLEYNKAIYEISKKTKRYMLMAQIMGVIKILLIVVPIVLAIIYLPPLIKVYLQPYQELMGGSSIIDQIKELQGTEQLKDVLGR